MSSAPTPGFRLLNSGSAEVRIDVDAVDTILGAHVDATPQLAATDDDTDDTGDERPAACDCLESMTSLPCWPCYRDGFETPNPDVARFATDD